MTISEQLKPTDIEILITQLGIETKGKGWQTVKSPFRDEKNPSFGINPKTGAWKDHATGETGDLVNLVSQLHDIDVKQATKWIAEQTSVSSALYGPPVNGKLQHEKSFWNNDRLTFIKAGIKRLKNEFGHELVKTAKTYDCLNLETLQKYGCGIVEKWGSDWLAFPYGTGCQLYKRNEEKNIRSVKGSSPGESFFGIKQTEGKELLFIAKSPRETMLLHQRYGDRADVIGLCTGEQASISKEQFEALRSQISGSKYEQIYIFLDCDTDMAHETAKEFKNQIAQAAENENVKLVNIYKSTGGTYKDITDCFRDGMDMDMFKVLLEDATKATKAKGNASTIDQLFDIKTAPGIPNDVYENVPDLLKTRCSLIEESHRRDVFLVSSLPVVASHMPNVLAGHADGYYTPDLFTQIIADPGAGKGIAIKAKKLGHDLNHHLIEQSRREKENFESLPDEEKNKISLPRDRCLFIPANSSSRAIYDTLDANGGWGLLFETEIDTMLNATNQEWGNFSDITRKAFHHEAVSINRKNERYFIDFPRLSICISGTFDQFKKMFESAENGHFSRYALYTFDVSRTWQSHRPTKKSRLLDESIQTASEHLYQMYRVLENRSEPLYIDLTPDQWQMIDDTFAKKMQIIEDLDLSSYLHASNNRAAVLALRMASMFAVLRTFEANPNQLNVAEAITPNDSDMIAALWLADTFIKHAIRLYQILPGATDTDGKGERYKKFISMLPKEFETNEAYGIAETLDIPERTVRYWLSNDNHIKRIKRGFYEKI